MEKNNQAGFSLIELLIVVVILGIVSAFAVPWYKKAIVGTENGAVFAMVKIMVQEQTNFYSQKGRYARLDEINSHYNGGFGTTVDNTIVRSKYTFSMTGDTAPPTDSELRDSFTIVATRTIDNAENPYVIQVTPAGDIEQVLP